LKAWIGFLGGSWPYTHDLAQLLNLLRQRGEDVGAYLPLVRYTMYAVQRRYELNESEETPLDREAVLHEVTALVRHVEKLANR